MNANVGNDGGGGGGGHRRDLFYKWNMMLKFQLTSFQSFIFCLFLLFFILRNECHTIFRTCSTRDTSVQFMYDVR